MVTALSFVLSVSFPCTLILDCLVRPLFMFAIFADAVVSVCLYAGCYCVWL